MKKIGLLLFALVFILLLAVPSSLMACKLPDGCTPGYWKQLQHFDNWVFYDGECAGLTPNALFSDVFGVPLFTPDDPTLLEVLKQGGGGVNAFGRHSVAALLNSCMSEYLEGIGGDFDYCFTPEEVIGTVQDAYGENWDKGQFTVMKNQFEYDNEKYCPLD
jgi:hypothetical protein